MFPAYRDTGGEKEEGECDDDADRYSSFDQEKILEARAKRDRVAKAERELERLKAQIAVKCINSDTDDEEVHVQMEVPSHFVPISVRRELPVEEKKKKSKSSKHRKRKNKDKKRKRRSSSHSWTNSRRTHHKSTSSDASSSSNGSDDERRKRRKTHDAPRLDIIRQPWKFLQDKEERSQEGTYIIYHQLYDHENFNMDAIPKNHTVDYKPRYFTVINGNARMDELFFAKELRELKQKRKRVDRYFNGSLRKLDDSNAERKFRKLPTFYETILDFVPLSTSKLKDFEFLHEISERKAKERDLKELQFKVEQSTEPHLVELEMQRQLIATEFANSSTKTPELLDKFLKISEEVFYAGRASSSAGDRKAIAERQLDIVDRAIASNQRAVEFRLKRLEYLKELRPKEDVLAEWEKILNAFVNKCSVWEKYLDFIQYDSSFYKKDVLERAFDRCFAKLMAILKGTFRSHKPEPNTANFLLHTYIRRLQWWMESGYTNRAVASIQATIEYNLLAPESLLNASDNRKREEFARFWSSGVPRFGDGGSKGGWRDFCTNSRILEDFQREEQAERALQKELAEELEARIGSSVDSLFVSWVEMERELDRIESRPRRPLDSRVNMDSDHAMGVVRFEDLRIFEGVNVHVVLSLLHALGARFGGSFLLSYSCANQPLPRLPTFRLLEEWDLLPSSRKLFPIPSPGALEMALNMLRAAVRLQPDLMYIIALLETKASQIELENRDRPTGLCVSKMRHFIKEIVDSFRQIVSIEEFDLVVTAYALKIFGRWVRDEKGDSSASSSAANGDSMNLATCNIDRRKRKKEKKEMFTSDQYIELLISFLSASNNMPLVQQNSLNLALLLRILLYLVQVLPCNRVLAEIARFFLRKGKNDEVSPTEALSALDEWKRVFRTLESFSKPEKVACFESSRALCIALRIRYEYARASKKSDQWIKECETHFKLSEQCIAADDKAVILGAFLDVLETHWKTYHTHKDKLIEVLELGQKVCPYDGSIIRRRINLSSSLKEKLSMKRMLANTPSVIDPTLDMYSSLARLYLEKNKVAKLVEAGAMPKSDIVAEITRAEASKRRDPALWRLALAQTTSSRFLSEAHVLASAQCGWSRHLHIDYIALSDSTKKCKEIISLMEERGVHVFNDLDYVKVLKGDERLDE